MLTRLFLAVLLLTIGSGPALASFHDGLTLRAGARGGLFSDLTLENDRRGTAGDLVFGLFNTRERTAEFFVLPMVQISRGGLISYDEIAIAAGVDSYRTAGGGASGTSVAFAVGLASIRGDTIETKPSGELPEATDSFVFKDQTVTTYSVLAEAFAAFQGAPRLFRQMFLEIKGLQANGANVSELEALSNAGLERSKGFVQIKVGVGLFYPL